MPDLVVSRSAGNTTLDRRVLDEHRRVLDDVAGRTLSEERHMNAARVGVITFPGSLDDRDAARAVRLAGAEPVSLWHADHDLQGVDAVILPGGFSYGDYLRCGAIARFAPIMEQLVPAANDGLPVLGICNGFQILCESHLLPGALMPNASQHFVCRDQRLRVENTETAWTSEYTKDQEIVVPLKNIDGRFVADEKTIADLEDSGRVVARYLDVNPNGSLNDIAGITNEAGNVVGLMPHPEHAVESLTGPTTDGLGFFTSILKRLVNA
jgi:phosphoribosylformylglycinamidine synthase I